MGKGENVQVIGIFSFSHHVFNMFLSIRAIYPLPNNKILDWSKLKAFAEDKIHMTVKLKLLWRNAAFSHNVFQRILIEGKRGSRYLSKGGGGGVPTENALVLLYDTLISGFQWM